MADISFEVQQLRDAEYGEEVRGAFISCMEKSIRRMKVTMN